ncbi:MAG: Uma2 family endonuclease [Thermoflexibacteraceae bacterium]
MSAIPNNETPEVFRATVDEYLFYEETSAEKYDYFRGQVIARAGGSEQHNDIEGNIMGELRNILANTPCKPFNSNTKVWIPQRQSFFYPDAAVACGDIDTNKKYGILNNPTVIFEVLSESTEVFDKGQKFAFYRTLPSLKEYILIAQDAYYIETFYLKTNQTWEYEAFAGADTLLKIKALHIEIPMKDIYRYVEIARETI